MKSFIRSFLLATVGALSFALAVSLFYDPHKVAAGGVTAYAVIVSHLFPIFSTGTVVFFFNLPLLILAAMRFGKKFAALTVYATALSSVLMNVFEPLAAVFGTTECDLLTASLWGAVLDGIGLGLVHLAGGCTGGVDIVIKFLRQRYRHIRTGAMSFAVNMSAVIAALLAFGEIEIAAYSAIAIVVSSFVLDKILYGGEGAKLVFIISDCHEVITEKLLKTLDAGVTLLRGEGAYLKREKKVILCAVKKQAFSKLREVVKDADPYAFMIITNATEIFGEGYKSQFTDEL